MQEKGSMAFPLMEKAKKRDVLSAREGWIISAPTATGKSRIGIEVIKRNLPRKPVSETFLFLVPFKALAEEMYNKIKDELKNELPNCVVNIKTGDYDRPFGLKETDVLIATYESADGIIQEGGDFYPTLVIADEFSIIADSQRGAKIESLISYLAKRPGTKLIALSAVIRNPERIGQWLGISTLEGDEKDRPVPLNIDCVFCKTKGDTVRKLVHNSVKDGGVLVFCSTKKGAERLCFDLREFVASTMNEQERHAAVGYSKRLKIRFPYLVDIPGLVRAGIAYHHADLELDLRNEIAVGFLEKKIKALVATTTLSTGVNLPARTVIVRDITRFAGRSRLLPVSEVVNMLGRAGRPGMDEVGQGYFLVPRAKAKKEGHATFVNRVTNRDVEEIKSQIPLNIRNTLHFILSTAARHRGIERDELIKAYNDTLWGFEKPLKSYELSKEEWMKVVEEEDILEPQKSVKIRHKTISVSGDTLKAKGGTGNYDISLSQNQGYCTCQSYKFGSRRPCKHIKQLQYEIVKKGIGGPEAKRIAIDSLEKAKLWKNPLYALRMGIGLLIDYEFLEEREGKLHITQDGRQSLVNYLLTMDQVRILRDRIKRESVAKNETDIIQWAIDDYRIPTQGSAEEERKGLSERFQKAVWEYIEGKQYQEIQVLGQKYIKRFLDAKDYLDQIFSAYLAFCPKDKDFLASMIRIAKRRVHYGCKKDILPLMVLEIDTIDKPNKARKLLKDGIADAKNLSRAGVSQISGLLEIPQDEANRVIEKAKSIHNLTADFSDKFAQIPKEELRSRLNTLAAQTGVKIDELLDYLLPSNVGEAIRKS